MDLPFPYALFLGEADQLAAKTATGIAYWRPDRCVAQVVLPGCSADLGLPSLSPREAASAGARLLVVGVAAFGGRISATWLPTLVGALEAGLDLAAGLHHQLADVPVLAEAARRLGRRLLTVGTDCAVGKMFTSLAIEAELLSPPNRPEHWDVIEGQGSLHHPAYGGVTLGLIHGSQPDALVLCHSIDRARVDGYENDPTPSFEAAIAANESAARLTFRSERSPRWPSCARRFRSPRTKVHRARATCPDWLAGSTW